MVCVERELTPIEKLIQFIKSRGYRPAEFFRMLDKEGARKLSHDELANRLEVGSPRIILTRQPCKPLLCTKQLHCCTSQWTAKNNINLKTASLKYRRICLYSACVTCLY